MDQNKFSKKKKKRGQWIIFSIGTLTGILLSIIFVIGFLLINNIFFVTGGYLKENNDNLGQEKTTIVDKEFTDKVRRLESIIREEFYLHDVDMEALENGAYQGMLDSLDDIYSTYYTKEEYKEVLESSEGIYYGIGSYVSMDEKTGYAVLSEVMKDTPADKSGLEDGDVIYKINGEDMAGLDLTQVVSKVKGEEGTSVELTILRDNKEMEFNVLRAKVETETVIYEILEDEIGYVRIKSFDEVAPKQFKEALDKFKEAQTKGLIVDLRGNPGGGLYTVLEIADMLLEEKLILYTEDSKGKRENYETGFYDKVDEPIIVLVDGGSASASEVLAGALKDYEAATLVGTTTFGKGIVQTLRMLKDGTAVKITTSAYYTPDGNNIHKIGIDPDIEVEFDAEQYEENEVDNQLQAAIEEMKKQMK